MAHESNLYDFFILLEGDRLSCGGLTNDTALTPEDSLLITQCLGFGFPSRGGQIQKRLLFTPKEATDP